jgi:hypothetical protein
MTIRKQILKAMEAAVSSAPTLGGRVFRSRAQALDKKEWPGLIIRPADETVSPNSEVAERDFRVQFLIIACEEGNETADDIADAVIGEVHDLLSKDPSFGGLAAQLFEESTRWDFLDAEGTTCELDVRYRVRLYTPEDSLTRTLE